MDKLQEIKLSNGKNAFVRVSSISSIHDGVDGYCEVVMKNSERYVVIGNAKDIHGSLRNTINAKKP